MGTDDKVGHKAQEVKGGVKEGFGKLTDNERLEAEGKAEKFSGKAKQAADDVVDAVKNDD